MHSTYVKKTAAKKTDVLFVVPDFGWIKSILVKKMRILPGIITGSNCNNDYD